MCFAILGCRLEHDFYCLPGESSPCSFCPAPLAVCSHLQRRWHLSLPRRGVASRQRKCSASAARVQRKCMQVQRTCSESAAHVSASASQVPQRTCSASGARVERKCSASAAQMPCIGVAQVRHVWSTGAARVQRKCSASAAKSTATRDCAQVQPRLKFCATSTQILHKCSFNSSSAWAQLFAKCTAAAGDGDRVQPKWRWGEGGAPRGSG